LYYRGVTFGVVARTDISVSGLELNLGHSTTTSDMNYHVYYRKSTVASLGFVAGAAGTSQGWTLAGQGTIHGDGVRLATDAFAGPIAMKANDQYSFYVSSISSGRYLQFARTGLPVGTVYASDGNVEFLVGWTMLWPFKPKYSKRELHGALLYTATIIGSAASAARAVTTTNSSRPALAATRRVRAASLAARMSLSPRRQGLSSRALHCATQGRHQSARTPRRTGRSPSTSTRPSARAPSTG